MKNIKGIAVSAGIAVGPVFIYEPFVPNVQETLCTKEQTKEQLERFKKIKSVAKKEISDIYAQMAQSDPAQAKIFAAHQEILDDEAITEEITEGIEDELWSCDWAVFKVFSKFQRLLEKAPDPIIRERSADIRDVCTRLLRIYYGVAQAGLSSLVQPVVVAARDLLPSDTATLERAKVLAILTEIGGPTSHVAIIARGYEIPAVAAVENLTSNLKNGQTVIVDALTGDVVLEPDEPTLKTYANKKEKYLKQSALTKEFLNKPPRTKDGLYIDIGLNIGSSKDDELFVQSTDFVGLFRTEFLYMTSADLPNEQEQFSAYKKVLESYAPKPVTIRTLDIGGDKTLKCLNLPKEDNPFLGNRALRLCFSMPSVFKVQLRALLRASYYGELWLMLPMVGSMDDIRQSKAFIKQVHNELLNEGINIGEYKIGIMIEIPAISMIADLAAAETDFASIGTNDLCQYLTATDRLNPHVQKYYQSYHPGMFRMLAGVINAYKNVNKPICVCGEMGGDPLASAVLIGLGMRKLSMGISSVAPIKQMLSELTISKAQELAQKAQSLATSGEIENYLKAELGGYNNV